MIRTAAFFLAIVALAVPARAQESLDADLRLYRLDCATPMPANPAFTLNLFSDTDAYSDAVPDLTFSCYLIRHGEAWLLWDTGLPETAPQPGTDAPAADPTLTSQLAALDLTPADIDYVGISHAHFDHVGNVAMFADATLIIQQESSMP